MMRIAASDQAGDNHSIQQHVVAARGKSRERVWHSMEIARLDCLAKEATSVPFISGASFDRSAIMKAAIASARLQKAKGSKAPWSQLVGSALRFIWIHAKTQRAFAAH